MLTARGWWVLALAVSITLIGVIGVARWSATIPILGLTLGIWFGYEWFAFAYRYRACADHFHLTRDLLQGGRVVPAVWSGNTFTVRITITLHRPIRLPFVHLSDRLPADISPPGTSSSAAVEMKPGQPVIIEYSVRADYPGVMRFEGVQVRTSDETGFFYRRFFVRQPVEYLVLPPLTDDEGRHRGTKRFNTLPPPGVHRLRRSGSGSELLDLRDYQPGDPPKMIAWKPSAKRGTLITKEIESEVPVRCVLFLDASNGARIGPPGHAPVVRMAEVAAAIAQVAGANRDLVGLTIFDETATDVTTPSRTRVHMVQMLRKLGEAASRLPDPHHTDAELLARYTYPVARQIYPDLMARDVNSLPFGLYWRPIADSRWFWAVLVLVALPALLIRPEGMEFVAKIVSTFSDDDWNWLQKFALLLGVFMLPPALAGLIWFIHGIRGVLPPRRTRTSRRKPLAALFAALDGTGPAALERHLNDDQSFVPRATQFLIDHRVRLPILLFDEHGHYRFRSERKLEVLASALIQAVTRARDNELYVILADMNELVGDLNPLVRAAQVARARHHQVLVIVPWPVDVPPPEERGGRHSRDSGHGRREVARKPLRIGGLVRSVLVSRYHRGFAELRRTLARAEATVIRAEDEAAVRLVLDRLDRLRGTRTHR